jgi:uncharacterized membrane-anchored protein
MKLPARNRPDAGLPGVTGTARTDRRTGHLLRRLRPGDVAVIDHLDLDRATAQSLVDAGVVAVVNASSFISGRYPNLGPELLIRSGVVLLDEVGPEVFRAVRDGAPVRIHDGAVLAGEELLASGRQLTAEDVTALMQDARGGLTTQLQSFTHNTTEFLRREEQLLLHGQGVPEVRAAIRGRPVIVVNRGYEYRADLRRLRRYIREQRPVLVGVDGGADALLEAGHRPDLVVVGERGLAPLDGVPEAERVSDKALRSAREVVLHTDRAGRTLGGDRLERLGVRAQTLAATSATQDVALLLADLSGAALIVAVGSHATLNEFLDRNRAGLASTFLTRLRIGPKLVDATSVPLLYSGRVRLWHLGLVLLTGVAALAVAVASTPVGQDWWETLLAALQDLLDWLQGLFT